MPAMRFFVQHQAVDQPFREAICAAVFDIDAVGVDDFAGILQAKRPPWRAGRGFIIVCCRV